MPACMHFLRLILLVGLLFLVYFKVKLTSVRFAHVKPPAVQVAASLFYPDHTISTIFSVIRFIYEYVLFMLINTANTTKVF